MHTWIFQANPKIYLDVEERLKNSGKSNFLIDWAANQNANIMKQGDKVYLWIAGANSGIHAIGQLVSEPRVIPNRPDKQYVNLKIEKLLGDDYVKRELFITNPILTKLPIVTANTGTNFLIQEDRQVMEIDKLIEATTFGLSDYQITELDKISQKEPEKLAGDEIDKLDSIFGDRDPDEILAELSARNLDKTPEERTSQQIRIKRDYALVKALKEKYSNKCQICGFTFKTGRGHFYSEAAHIKPISSREKGVDTVENIIILCANHHRMLDNGAIKVISNKEFEIDGKKIFLTQ